MISVSILYFASFREKLNCKQETLELDEHIKTIADLKHYLARRQHAWHDIFHHDNAVLASINQSMAKNHSILSNNDEIAFFPPVTGG